MKTNAPYDFFAFRNRLLNDVILGMLLTSIPTVALSLARMMYLGWLSVMAAHLSLLVALFLLWLLRERLAYRYRVGALLSVFWIAGFAGLAQFGPTAGSREFFILLSFVGILFYSVRTGILLVIGNILCLVLFAFIATQKKFAFDLDYQTYAHHPLTWVSIVWTLSAYSTIVAYIGFRMVHGLREREKSLQQIAARQQKIAAQIPGMIYQYLLRKDGSRCFPYVSPGIYDIFGVSPEAVSEDAAQVLNAVHPDDLARVTEAVQASCNNLTVLHIEYRVRHPQKGELWLESHAVS